MRLIARFKSYSSVCTRHTRNERFTIDTREGLAMVLIGLLSLPNGRWWTRPFSIEWNDKGIAKSLNVVARDDVLTKLIWDDPDRA